MCLVFRSETVQKLLFTLVMAIASSSGNFKLCHDEDSAFSRKCFFNV